MPFLLCLRALSEIGDHAEAAAGILDDGHGSSPFSHSFFRRVLVLNFEVLHEPLLHFRIASSNGFLFSTSKSFMNHFSIFFFFFLYLIFLFHKSLKRERETETLSKKISQFLSFFKIEAGFVSATQK